MTKTEQLNLLFEDWDKARKCYNEDNDHDLFKFCLDGIIDEKEFNKQKIKVLFISNEANLGEDFKHRDETNNVYDRRINFLEYKKEQYDEWVGKLRERVSALYQVIKNDYNDPIYSVADQFAFINLNKRGGTDKWDIEHLEKYCTAYKEEIIKEIEIISPDLIVWLGCNSFDSTIPETLGFEKSEDGYIAYLLLKSLNKKISALRMWHTSTRSRMAETINVFPHNRIIDKLATKLYQELERIK